VRQLHSWSRLLTSHALLDYVLSTFDSRVNDFILPFGVKHSETDIGGPRLWYFPGKLGDLDREEEYGKYYGQSNPPLAAIGKPTDSRCGCLLLE